MTRVLLLGGSGFIGRNVLEYLRNIQDVSVACPNSTELNCEDFIQVKNYLNKNSFDIVLNFAVYHNRIDINKDPNLVLRNNLLIYYNFERLSSLYGKMFYLGSGAEYDKRYPIVDVTEEMIGASIPIDQYGFAKYIVGNDIEKSDNIYNLRLFGVYGQYEDYKTRFISNIICKSLFNKQLTIRKNVYFSYLYINDFVKLLYEFMFKNLKYKTYNLVPNEKIDLLSIVKIVNKEFDRNADIEVFKSGLDNEYTASNKRLLLEVPDFKFTDVSDAVKILHKYYKDNIDFIDKESLVS